MDEKIDEAFKVQTLLTKIKDPLLILDMFDKKDPIMDKIKFQLEQILCKTLTDSLINDLNTYVEFYEQWQTHRDKIMMFIIMIEGDIPGTNKIENVTIEQHNEIWDWIAVREPTPKFLYNTLDLEYK